MVATQSAFGVSRSASGRAWALRSGNERLIRALMQRHALSDNVARILSARGMTLEAVDDFLRPRLQNLMPDPSSLIDMDKAAARLAQAIIDGENIAIFGDYDVDGATSSALIARYLSALGCAVQIYIPDRQKEGYGPNIDAFDRLAAAGAQLIITVDCGTMAHDALASAQKKQIDVIVADHHQSGKTLPEAFAIVNPRRLDDDSGMGYLAAVGVCFLLLVALNRTLTKAGYFDKQSKPDLLQFLDIVALGTVCDVVPLVGLNRAFVQQGLRILNQHQNIGLVELARIARANAPLDVYALGFLLGPRINAGGRVGAADFGVRLLTTNAQDEAQALAMRLDEYNGERKAIEARVLADARAQAETYICNGTVPPVFVLADVGWHSGVVGIVASRLKDMFGVPCFVIAIDEDARAKGSARSVRGIDIGGLVAHAVRENIAESGGGHAMAAGIGLPAAKIDAFRAWLIKILQDRPRSNDGHMLWIDAVVAPAGANRALVDDIAQLAPFGVDNPEPRFVLPHAKIIHAEQLEGGHVRCVLSGDGGGRLKAMGFASLAAEARALLSARIPCHIVGYLRADNWRTRRDAQFIITDVAKS